MVYIPAVNTVRIAMEQLFGGQQFANIIYMLFSGVPTETIISDLLDDVQGWWDGEIAPLVTTGLSLVGLTGTDLTTSTSPSVTKAVSPAVPGEVSGEGTTAHTAAVVSFRTAGRGRSSRGRNYVPGAPYAALASGLDFTSTFTANLIAAYEALSSVEAANSCAHVVASFITEGQPRETAYLQQITSYTMDTAIDSQRRRLRLRGV